MMRPSDIDRAARTAADRWRREWCPFAGVPAVRGVTVGATFGFEKSPFRSYVLYERDVVLELRRVQRARAEHELEGGEHSIGRRATRHREALVRLEQLVKSELRQVREAVDWELEAGRGCVDTVGSLRALPVRPRGVRQYSTLEAYVAENLRRAVSSWPDRRDLDGADCGSRWRLEDPSARWRTTSWRISWLHYEYCHADNPHELYSVEHLTNGDENLGRVWLLATFPPGVSPVNRMWELFERCTDDRNSLAYAATVAQSMAATVDRSAD